MEHDGGTTNDWGRSVQLTGQRSATAEEQRARYDGCKSFLHGKRRP